MKTSLKISALALFSVMLSVVSARAESNEYDAKLQQLVTSKLEAIASNSDLVAEVKRQNDIHASYDAAKIDALDKVWRSEAEKGGGVLVTDVLNNPISKYLVQTVEGSGGLFAELIVMDNKGLNVAISNLTSDYMQGDEDKWQKSFTPNTPFVDAIKKDESTGIYISQVSIPIHDPETKSVIGAMTFGVNVEKLP